LIGGGTTAVGAFFLGKERADCLLNLAYEMFFSGFLSCRRRNSSDGSGGVSNRTFVAFSRVDATQCRENGKARTAMEKLNNNINTYIELWSGNILQHTTYANTQPTRPHPTTIAVVEGCSTSSV
jgi:hypothetical protein